MLTPKLAAFKPYGKHLLLAAVVGKYLASPADAWAAALVLALVLGYRAGNRFLAQSRRHRVDEDKARIERLEREVQGLIQTQNLRGIGR